MAPEPCRQVLGPGDDPVHVAAAAVSAALPPGSADHLKPSSPLMERTARRAAASVSARGIGDLKADQVGAEFRGRPGRGRSGEGRGPEAPANLIHC